MAETWKSVAQKIEAKVVQDAPFCDVTHFYPHTLQSGIRILESFIKPASEALVECLEAYTESPGGTTYKKSYFRQFPRLEDKDSTNTAFFEFMAHYQTSFDEGEFETSEVIECKFWLSAINKHGDRVRHHLSEFYTFFITINEEGDVESCYNKADVLKMVNLKDNDIFDQALLSLIMRRDVFDENVLVDDLAKAITLYCQEDPICFGEPSGNAPFYRNIREDFAPYMPSTFNLLSVDEDELDEIEDEEDEEGDGELEIDDGLQKEDLDPDEVNETFSQP